MASPAVDSATGITLDFADSNFAMQLLDCELAGMLRGYIPTSHQSSGVFETFAPKRRVDRGSVEAAFHYNPSADPPIDAAAEVITIVWPNGETTHSFTGFMTNFRQSGKMDDKMVATATIKISGDITITEVP